MTKLIILDRDGVINYDSKHYIKSPDEWHAIPGSLEAIAELNTLGFQIAVASNQSGVARGYYSEETLGTIHQKMQDQCAAVGAHIESIHYCPHLPTHGCNCRKPKPGLLLDIATRFNCELTGIPFIGDRESDILTAIAAGAQPILINNDAMNHNPTSLAQTIAEYSVPCFPDLAGYVKTTYCR